MQDLGTLPGIPGSLANGINNRSQVVGFSDDFNGNTVALLWQNCAMTNLNTLIPPNSPLFLLEALSINDRGQIAGFGQLSDGEHRGFLLTPCDEKEGGDKGYGEGGGGNAVSSNQPSSSQCSQRDAASITLAPDEPVSPPRSRTRPTEVAGSKTTDRRRHEI
jgi:probable HAF family extracellular repeat protein